MAVSVLLVLGGLRAAEPLPDITGGSEAAARKQVSQESGLRPVPWPVTALGFEHTPHDVLPLLPAAL